MAALSTGLIPAAFTTPHRPWPRLLPEQINEMQQRI